MKFVDEFREPEIITRTAEEIRRLADPGRHYRFMEVCGGHTHAIYRFGLKISCPPNIDLIHGPGCPGLCSSRWEGSMTDCPSLRIPT